ncbi:MAG: TerB family tellurite resistance protein [Bacteroidetes bacterium]|nr:MAG: TerB family tellurite resistance protein [Bacteroidota bacterium]
MIRKQLNTLVQLGSVDGLMSEKEVRLVKLLGSVNGMSDEEIDSVIENPEPMEDLTLLSDDQKFEYIYSLVQLMKADGQVFKSEIAYCENVAKVLGYKKSVIGEISSRIYSDPAITADRDKLKEKAQKYLL